MLSLLRPAPLQLPNPRIEGLRELVPWVHLESVCEQLTVGWRSPHRWRQAGEKATIGWTVMERRGIRLPQTDASSAYREARRRRRGAGGERSGRVWGLSRLPFLPAGSTPCEWAELPRGYPQCPTVVKRTRSEVREFSKLATLSSRRQEHRDTKSTDSSVRRAIV